MLPGGFSMEERKQGILAGLFSNILWGVLPLY
jgi:EamA domain-containing membrane protein RarD